MPPPTTTPPGTDTAGTYYFLDRHINADGLHYNGVVSGLAVSQSGTPSLTLQVAAGTFHQFNLGDPNRDYAGGTITLPAADAALSRIDLISIYFDEGGDGLAHVVVTPGTLLDNSAPQPVSAPPEDRDAGVFNIVLAVVLVYPGAIEILDDTIYDRRFFLPFLFSGNVDRLATSLIEGGGPTTTNRVVIFDANGNLNASDRDVDTLGDVSANVTPVVDGQVVLYAETTGRLIRNATSSGRPLLTGGVLSVAPVNLSLEVTGDLPLVNLAPASAASRLLGRGSASAGDYEEVSLGSGLIMTGAVLAATAGSSSAPYVSAQGLYHTDNSERNLLSFTIPGGVLGTVGGVLWFLTGRFLANSGTNTLTLRVKLGATTLLGDASPTITNNAAYRSITLWGMLFNSGVATSQLASISGEIGQTNAGSIAGVMEIAVANTAAAMFVVGSGPGFENTASDKVMAITSQFAISNINVQIEWKASAYLLT